MTIIPGPAARRNPESMLAFDVEAAWVPLPEGVPAMREYYDRGKCWPKESLEHHAAQVTEPAESMR